MVSRQRQCYKDQPRSGNTIVALSRLKYDNDDHLTSLYWPLNNSIIAVLFNTEHYWTLLEVYCWYWSWTKQIHKTRKSWGGCRTLDSPKKKSTTHEVASKTWIIMNRLTKCGSNSPLHWQPLWVRATFTAVLVQFALPWRTVGGAIFDAVQP